MILVIEEYNGESANAWSMQECMSIVAQAWVNRRSSEKLNKTGRAILQS